MERGRVLSARRASLLLAQKPDTRRIMPPAASILKQVSNASLLSSLISLWLGAGNPPIVNLPGKLQVAHMPAQVVHCN